MSLHEDGIFAVDRVFCAGVKAWWKIRLVDSETSLATQMEQISVASIMRKNDSNSSNGMSIDVRYLIDQIEAG